MVDVGNPTLYLLLKQLPLKEWSVLYIKSNQVSTVNELTMLNDVLV